jgi:hypothetical protein
VQTLSTKICGGVQVGVGSMQASPVEFKIWGGAQVIGSGGVVSSAKTRKEDNNKTNRNEIFINFFIFFKT